jgi:hypothetical protein
MKDFLSTVVQSFPFLLALIGVMVYLNKKDLVTSNRQMYYNGKEKHKLVANKDGTFNQTKYFIGWAIAYAVIVAGHFFIAPGFSVVMAGGGIVVMLIEISQNFKKERYQREQQNMYLDVVKTLERDASTIFNYCSNMNFVPVFTDTEFYFNFLRWIREPFTVPAGSSEEEAGLIRGKAAEAVALRIWDMAQLPKENRFPQ